MIDNSCLYRSPEGYAAMMAAYDATLNRWPIPYECLTVPTRHGETHLIASSAPEAPPLVLLGGRGGERNSPVCWRTSDHRECEMSSVC